LKERRFEGDAVGGVEISIAMICELWPCLV
jgi:hypothetical protein